MELGFHAEIGGGRTGALLLSVRRGLISAINVAASPAASPGWELIPFGRYPNPVGIQVFDWQSAEQMTTDFRSRLRTEPQGIPIFEGHPDDANWLKENPGNRIGPVGRITDMESCAAGLRLFCAMNGGPLTRNFTHISPRWNMAPLEVGVYRPVSLLSIGLTNKPNIPGTLLSRSYTPALNTSELRTCGDFVSAIAEIQSKHGLQHEAAWQMLRLKRPEVFR